MLHVVHGLPRGGLENGVVNLLNGLPADRIEQAVCCLDRRGEMAERIRRPLPIWVLDRTRHDLRIPLRLAGLIRRWRPDIIHCRNWNTWLDTVLAHRLAGARSQLVWGFHGFADGDCFPRRRRVASRILAGATDHLLAVCHDAATRFAGMTGIRPERFVVRYNGVDCERFRPSNDRAALRASLGIGADTTLILTVASLTPVKDHATLVDALAGLSPSRRQGVRALFLGDGAERPRLQQQIRARGLNDVVRMPGGSDQIADHLRAADIFVLPSRLEGMSNAILEAMASALPVIAAHTGGNPELIRHERTGLLCTGADAASFSAALARLLGDAAMRRAMGDAAREQALEQFSLSAMMRGYADYYAGLVGTDRTGTPDVA